MAGRCPARGRPHDALPMIASHAIHALAPPAALTDDVRTLFAQREFLRLWTGRVCAPGAGETPVDPLRD